MKNKTQARARAQQFGPEMVRVIDEAVLRIEAEIRTARTMTAGEVMALLLVLLEPLREMSERVHGSAEPRRQRR